ncbi:RraA family protein [Amaricoccus tamworthensis]|uniref:RraA family protein n=1 Tax=Amaricoccus tamworthensis TaxID=57002 RepID=UPI003C7B159E
MDETDLFKRIREELFTAVIGDVLDVMGHRLQFLPPGVVPLQPEIRIVGRAMPVHEVAWPEGTGDGPLTNQPFGIMFQALDDLKRNEIYVASGSSLNFALWGGLMSTRARHLNAAGAILDGFVRDTAEIRELGFPVFSRGVYAQDQGVRGKVVDFRTPITIGDVRINDGDLIVADDEGVLVIPREAEEEAITAAFKKAATENKVAEAIRNGMSSQEAFATFGVM